MVRVHGVAPPEGPAEKGTARTPTLAPARGAREALGQSPACCPGPADPLGSEQAHGARGATDLPWGESRGRLCA